MTARGFMGMLAVLLACMGLFGCGSDAPGPGNSGGGSGNAHGEDGHAHGPRGGHLLEVGDGTYHLELLLDDKTNTVTAHILDKEAKNDVAVDAPNVVISFLIKGERKPFTLEAASPNAEGKASKFVLTDQDLAAALETHEEDLKSEIALTIDGKEFKIPFKFHHH